ncbi:MAG TPA: DUF1302 family protein [Polyangia bacterium]|nr:DUF1302 family protein [Polyangia bacterium]
MTALCAGLTTALLVALGGGRASAQPAGGVPSGDNPPGTPPAGAPSTETPSSDAVGSEPSEGSPGLFEDATKAVPTPAASSGAPLAGPSGFQLHGYVRGDMFAGKVSDVQAAELKSGYGELAIIARTPKESFGDAFAEARIRYGLQGDGTQATVVDLREAYANVYAGPFSLRLGQQIIVWGRADALNPTSNLTPVDFRVKSPLEDDIRLGNPGARAFLKFAPFRLEGVWMPIYLPTELPAVALPQDVYFTTPVYPSLDLRNATEGARLHLELPAIEMSVSYVYGWALLPGLTRTGLTLTANPDMTPGTEPPSVLISRTAYHQQVFGFDFSTALGEVATLRGEAAYRLPEGYNIPNSFSNINDHHVAYPDLQYVLGADHNFGSLSIIVQYMGRYVTASDYQKQTGPEMPLDAAKLATQPPGDEKPVAQIVDSQLAKTNQILFSQTAKLQHLGTLRFEWLGAHDTLSISSLCMYNFTTHEWVVTPRIGYHFSDAVMAYVGAQVFHGPPDTLFGLIDAELSAGYVELRYTF